MVFAGQKFYEFLLAGVSSRFISELGFVICRNMYFYFYSN